ncbi:MAG: DUF192 domain-containing protein [Phycisphaerae bacterium]|nr:DUF192 domain-containing protein [Phycisphaerae bacterium]
MAPESILIVPTALGRILAALALFFACATLAACAEPARPGLERVVIKGTTFWVEGVFEDATRIKGLGGRESIPEDGGMLFVFPYTNLLEFVMRDCKFDIDIAFLDDSGRVVAWHTMKNEPRNPGESDSDYENRLKRYPSTFAARFAVELRAGTLARLGVKPGDLVELDTESLKRRAK